MSADKELPDFLLRKKPEQYQSDSQERFRSLRGVTSVLQCTNLIAMFMIAAMAAGLLSLRNNVGADPEVIKALLANQQRLQVATVVLSLVNALAFFTWTHRAYGNLPALDYKNCTCSPDLAIILFFVPIFNALVFLRVFSELAEGSNPENWPPKSKRSAGPNLLVYAWWISSIVGGGVAVMLAIQFSAQEPNYDNLSEYLGQSAWLTIASLLPAAIAFIVFATISANQEARHKLITKAPRTAKPNADMSFLQG